LAELDDVEVEVEDALGLAEVLRVVVPLVLLDPDPEVTVTVGEDAATEVLPTPLPAPDGESPPPDVARAVAGTDVAVEVGLTAPELVDPLETAAQERSK